MSKLFSKTKSISLLKKLIRQYLLRLFFLSIYIIILLEIFLRVFFYISLSLYLNENIPLSYRTQLKKIHLFQSQRTPGWTKFDPLCYTLPQKNLFFRSHSSPGQCSYPEEKPKGEIRIMCLGDSATYGVRHYDETYPYILEKLLANKFPSKNIKVLNTAIPGVTFRQIKRTFQFHLVKYNPDIVLCRMRTWLTDSYEVPQNLNIIRYNICRILFNFRTFQIICTIIDHYKPESSYTAEKIYDFITKRGTLPKNSHQKLNSDFSIIKRIASEHKIKYVLGVDYVAWHKETGKISSDYNEYIKKKLTPVVYTLNGFNEKLKQISVKELFLDGCHLTKLGNSIVAQEIFAFLRAKKWIEKVSLKNEKV